MLGGCRLTNVGLKMIITNNGEDEDRIKEGRHAKSGKKISRYVQRESLRSPVTYASQDFLSNLGQAAR